MRSPDLDRIERMIGDFERRRAAVSRELEYYRIAAFWRAPKELPAPIEAAGDQKFCGLLARLSCKDMRDLIASR
jgi:hypothetical protein